MSLKLKIFFYNLIIFLIIFDLVYLLVWIFALKMNLGKSLVVFGIAVLLMPWARLKNPHAGQKVAIRSLAFNLFKKYRSNRDC